MGQRRYGLDRTVSVTSYSSLCAWRDGEKVLILGSDGRLPSLQLMQSHLPVGEGQVMSSTYATHLMFSRKM